MPFSMTGYGKSEYTDEKFSISVEIKSVNSRYCDLSIKMPKMFNPLEDKVRKLVTSKISRGKIDLYVSFTNLDSSSKTILIDKPLALAYAAALDEICLITSVPNDNNASTIARFPEVITTKNSDIDVELIWEKLGETIEMALINLRQMRQIEGEQLKNDICDKVSEIEADVTKIKERSPELVAEYKSKLEKRINDLLEGKFTLDDSRLAQEVAIFSDKCSIDEEITRLISHINQMRQIITHNEPIGRKLDFLVQEFNREANTIGSKANDVTITNIMLNIKNNIEKIREQVQNLE